MSNLKNIHTQVLENKLKLKESHAKNGGVYIIPIEKNGVIHLTVEVDKCEAAFSIAVKESEYQKTKFELSGFLGQEGIKVFGSWQEWEYALKVA